MKKFIDAAVVIGLFSFASSAQAGPLRCLVGKVVSPVKAVVDAQPVRSTVKGVRANKPVRATVGKVFGGCSSGSCGL